MFHRVIQIGLGGIWSYSYELIGRMLAFQMNAPKKLVLIDGDEFEMKNIFRQSMHEVDQGQNKAQVYAIRMRRMFPELNVVDIRSFLIPKNAPMLIEDGSIVMTAVDNHATRKLVSDTCRRLNNVAVIQGGNHGDGTAHPMSVGDLYFHLRIDGVDVTKPIERVREEINNGQDRNPGEMDCAARAALPGGQQLATTNAMVGVLMGARLGEIIGCLPDRMEVLKERVRKQTEVVFDINKFSMISYSHAQRAPVNH